jgi:hypothetical protein
MIALALVVACAGCVFEWDQSALVFTLEGNPPPLSSFHKLNVMPSGLATEMIGPDGANWVGFCEFWNAGSVLRPRGCQRAHLVRADPGGTGTVDETFNADNFIMTPHELLVLIDDDKSMTRTIGFHRPGDPSSANQAFDVNPGQALIYTNGSVLGTQSTVVYWAEDPMTKTFSLLRRDPLMRRDLPIPMGVDPAKPLNADGFDFLLTADGNWLIERDPDGTMTAFSSLGEPDVSFGKRPSDFRIDDPRESVITIGPDGLRSIPIAGGPDKILAPEWVDASLIILRQDQAFYPLNGALWRVPLDGSQPPEKIADGGARILALDGTGDVAYSRDPADRYVGGAGDGWLGNWNFMQRGRSARFALDGTRLRFLEHAATLDTVGDLTSVTIPNGPPVTLGINVHSYDELPDHRVLAIENHVYAGDWNRLVVIDEQAITKKWVVPSAAEFLLLPGGQRIVADVVTGASGYDIMLLDAPPP